ncbi:uncharacterized protein J3R85_010918 [Psidium guajava]|nr:uncharacterized protein J3R85_010918 [Psidium guajava]
MEDDKWFLNHLIRCYCHLSFPSNNCAVKCFWYDCNWHVVTSQ